MSDKKDGLPLLDFKGEALCGMVIVLQNPRIAEVRMRDASSASRSGGINRDLNWTNGLIINEFHRYVSSKLSISKESELRGLVDRSQHMSLKTAIRSKTIPVLYPVSEIEIRAVVKGAIAEQPA